MNESKREDIPFDSQQFFCGFPNLVVSVFKTDSKKKNELKINPIPTTYHIPLNVMTTTMWCHNID